ncbi:hypothetical protein PENSPDRAFT_751612 [Peniophora sp. CONT]|nr:hypothetical protein PENSPDRAFT_751612 [Peniophora sp. CONT]
MFTKFGVVALQALFAASAHGARLVDFQVAQPPPLPKDAKQCTIRLFEHTFANSYNVPVIVDYTPPTDCGDVGSWAGISLNFTATSNGTQYDRLGVFTFHNVEIWRTSTPEPTSGDGIIWQYLKDVTRFQPLFAKAGLFILELDNIVQTGLTGEYATTLVATFYASSSTHPPATTADVIIPISTLSNTSSDDASVPPSFSLNVTFPVNSVSAYAELQASGNGEEEFWYFNAPNDYLDLLPSGTTYGTGPFREVRFLVDGQVAGVAFPYPVIFTGGIIPNAWRPITSYGAIDLPTYHFDLSPFIPVLADGEPHTVTLDVASAEKDHGINSNWYVSGAVHVVLGDSEEPTTGTITLYNAEDYATTTESGGKDASGAVAFNVGATRNIHIESTIIAGGGKETKVVFKQNLQYSNKQAYNADATIEVVKQIASGSITSTHDGTIVLEDTFSYPLTINLTATDVNFNNYSATFDHFYDRVLQPAPFLLGSTIAEHQVSGGRFVATSSGNIGINGTSENTFKYVDTKGNTFDQTVNAASNVITLNKESGNLAPSPLPASTVAAAATHVPLKMGARLPGGNVAGQ